ncbi:aspartate:alanine exchanger family transporter [Pontiella sulfatireligans]|uniref:Aspartate/alanine antiporter n=1 Tax=Pontiella sulfatireligans TaxID=2750658 RepID=A0A6C2UQK9_9BACT|nr:aspartate:alanine exchanger family transporter [Pontiella sulfatireligans]VGO22582.1 Aspartate/alanine antiporter [Pontiella sulfatireligans]
MGLDALHNLLLNQPLVVLFALIATGLLLGSVKVKGINLGSSGVLFTALLAGHLGYSIPAGVGTLGLVLFVYCVGIGAGDRFFASLVREGTALAKLAVLIVVLGAATTWIGATLLDIPTGLATGIFAGALTSTPALAAATEGMAMTAQSGADAVSIGYGIAYPFGVIGVVLFVQVLPRILKIDVDAITDKPESQCGNRVENVLVEVTNPNLYGQRISESGITNFNACQICRIYSGGSLVPLQYDNAFEENQILLLVGRSCELQIAIDLIGHRSDRKLPRDIENERQSLVVTSTAFIGQKLGDLAPLRHYGVVVTRITRLGLTFVPNANTVIERHDHLTCVGRADDLKKFSSAVGHRSSAIDATDLLSLSVGLTLGIILGLLPFGLPGGTPITLGLAGGPLFVALILGHFGKIGPIVGFIPRQTRMLLQELGLVFFLANAGVRGGGALVSTLQEHGFVLFGLGICVSVLPLIVAWPIATKHFKMNPLQALGGICGGMTSTPALGAITDKTDSQTPVISYVSAYPVALIFMIIISKLLIKLLG